MRDARAMNDASATDSLLSWVEGIRHDFTAGAATVFLLHGVRDLLPYQDRWVPLPEFLHLSFCGGKRTVVYSIASGITFPTPEDEQEFKSFLEVRAARGERPLELRDSYRPELAVPVLQDYLLSRDRVALIIDFVDKLFPAQEERFMSPEERRLLGAVRAWATDPRLTRRNSFVLMYAESLSDVHEDLYTRGGGTRVVQIPFPHEAMRRAYLDSILDSSTPPADGPAVSDSDLRISRQVLAQVSNGMTLRQIGAMVKSAHAVGRPLDLPLVAQHKRMLIEQEIGDLVQFTTSELGLDAVAGVDRQKQLLLDTARALREGNTELVPKGILLLGPPGTGKTFTMTCFARDCGIPFVELRNVFSKYVGSTEANLEKLFHYLEALAPVFVFIDEFDQSYGRRVTSDTDSGVSRRVFGMFNNFLADESHQGRIIFGAATNRPDLIDHSTLRAGRFDLKMPFLLPDGPAREAILRITLRNRGLDFAPGDLSDIVSRTAGYSGADLAELVRLAHRHAFAAGREQLTVDDLRFAVDDYIAPHTARGDEMRMMELLAVANTTSRSLLPPEYVAAIESGALHRDLEALRLRLGW